MPSSNFNQQVSEITRDVVDVISKVHSFNSSSQSVAEELYQGLKQQVQGAASVGGMSYSDARLQAFFAQDELAIVIHQVDTQLTTEENQIKAAREKALKQQKEQQAEWANHHPLTSFLQNVTSSVGNFWSHDVVDNTRLLGEKIPDIKYFTDQALCFEGFVGAAGDMVSSLAIGASQLSELFQESQDLALNTLTGTKTPDWEVKDITGTGQSLANLGHSLGQPQTYINGFNGLVKYIQDVGTDPYAMGGAVFNVASFLVPGLGEAGAAADGARGASMLEKLADGASALKDLTLAKGAAAMDKISEGADVLKAASGAFGKTLFDEFAHSPKMASFMGSGEIVNLGKATVVASKEASTVFKTERIINSVESGRVELLNNIQKGNFGEMKMDQIMRQNGYKRISTDRVTDLNQAGHQGIDGVYENPNGHPPYIVGEAKYGSSRLGNTADGRQMSKTWIDNRLDDAVENEELSEKIKNSNYGSVIIKNIKSDGNYVERNLDNKGYVIKGGGE